jgi:hypothetical protein
MKLWLAIGVVTLACVILIFALVLAVVQNPLVFGGIFGCVIFVGLVVWAFNFLTLGGEEL